MTDTTDTIRVTALDRELTFEDREELAEYVGSFLDHGQYSPMEQAALRTLAGLENGDTPPQVERIVDKVSFRGPSTDAEAERRDGPFGERIETLDAERQERAAELEEIRGALHETRRQLRALDRRKAREGLSRAERRKIEEEIQQLRRQLHAQNEDVQTARRAAIRATAAWNKAQLAADRWRYDQAARFVVGPPDDRRVVDREELMEWIDRHPDR